MQKIIHQKLSVFIFFVSSKKKKKKKKERVANVAVIHLANATTREFANTTNCRETRNILEVNEQLSAAGLRPPSISTKLLFCLLFQGGPHRKHCVNPFRAFETLDNIVTFNKVSDFIRIILKAFMHG